MNEKLFEYRIRYNAGENHSKLDNYHYYMAETACQAFYFHVASIKNKHTCVQNISIEKYNPYSQKWEDKSEVIDEQESNYYS
jgi:hypothetical protein